MQPLDGKADAASHASFIYKTFTEDTFPGLRTTEQTLHLNLLSHIQEENAMINYRKNLMLAVNSGNSEYLKRVNN